MCLIAEIIHTCSHEKVAHAAVASMGSSFAGKVGATAGARGLSIGAFTARAVREFGEISGEDEKQAIRTAIEGSDQPILTGLQHILWPIIEGKGADLRTQTPSPARARGEDQTRNFAKFLQSGMAEGAPTSI
ncbi:MAG: hypothetical protein L0Y60_12355 [Beijerinckiaceae bacterium]|nr:hypothetical protein [Beijerinckiaceae bacterium]